MEALGVAGEGELGGGVGEHVGDGEFAADGGDVDDGSGALLEHVGEGVRD